MDGAPSLSLPGLADRASEVVDSSSLRFLPPLRWVPPRARHRDVQGAGGGGKKKEEEQKKAARSSASSAPKEDEGRKGGSDDFLMGTDTAMWAWAPLMLFVVWCLLGIMAGVCQKDSCALLVYFGSGMLGWFAGDSAPRAVFLSLS